LRYPSFSISFLDCPRFTGSGLCSLCACTRVAASALFVAAPPFDKSCVFDHFVNQNTRSDFATCFTLVYTVDLVSSKSSSVTIMSFDRSFLSSSQYELSARSACSQCISAIFYRSNCLILESRCLCGVLVRCNRHLNHECNIINLPKSDNHTYCTSLIWSRFCAAWKDLMRENLKESLESHLSCVVSLESLRRNCGFDFRSKFVRVAVTAIEQVEFFLFY
jgi:hypothetical protein